MDVFFKLITGMDLFLMLLTPAAYFTALVIHRKCIRHQFLHPLILSVIFVISMLIGLDISYTDYIHANRLFEWLIGPAVVSLAIPLYENLHRIKRWLVPAILTIIVVLLVTPATTALMARLMTLQPETQIALSTRSVTTPIALSINELLQGNRSLAASIVMTTGIFGALLAPPILRVFKIESAAIEGITLGLTAHAIGTQRAFENSSTCGAFAALTMILTGIFASLILPFLGLLLTS